MRSTIWSFEREPNASYERLIEDARQLLMSLARLSAVRDRNRAACNALFADLLTQHSSYANLGVVDADGNVFCSAVPITDQVYLGDRVYFRRALETRDFAIGEYQVGRITGKAARQFRLSCARQRGHVRAVVVRRARLTGSTNWPAKRDCRQEQCSP